MRKILCFFIIILAAHQVTAVSIRTGFYLSIGQMHYKLKSYAETGNPIIEPSDLFLNASLQIPNRWEVNLVYNRTKGRYLLENQTLTFDKDGLGLEAGKIISMRILTKESFRVSLEFAGGIYALYYFYKKIETDNSFTKQANNNDSTHTQWGFYWTIRLKNIFTKKASLDLGFKSILPVNSNEYISSDGSKFLHFKSFLYIGISF